MNKSILYLAVSACFLTACSGIEQYETQTDIPYTGDVVERVIFDVLPIRDIDEAETKASAVPSADGKTVSFQWEVTDTVGIFPDTGSQIYFTMENGAGTSSADFTGGGWALKQNSTYVSYYPFVADFYLKSNKVPLSFSGQKQVGTTAPFVSARYYLASDATSSSNGVLRFTYNTLNTIINIKATLPAGTYIKASLTLDEPLFVEEGTYDLPSKTITGTKYSKTLEIDLEDFTLTEQSTVPVYIMSAPVDLKNKEVTVLFFSSEEKKYRCVKTPASSYQAGIRYGLLCTMEDYYGDNIEFADATVKRACVEKYDTNGDREISYEEAAAVQSISGLFDNYRTITSFDEFQYFTSVTYIPDRAFARMTILKSITLPESITRIGNYAFTECSRLASFNVPKNVTRIGTRAFEKCVSLAEFTFSEGTQLEGLNGWSYYDIDGNSTGYCGLFGFCSSLSSFTIPASVTSLGNRLFYQCSSLKEVIFEEGSEITTIPGDDWNSIGGTFSGCPKLETVVLPETITSIGYGAFMNCGELKNIDLPSGITSIANMAFRYCYALEGPLYFPNCRFIGEYAFEECRNLSSITLNNNCTVVGRAAFASCRSLESIVLSNAQVTIEPYTFYGCSSLESVDLPDYLSFIREYAFCGCSGLLSMVIPESVVSLGREAFSNCASLTSISIPESVESIGYYAFSGCTSLTSINIPETISSIVGFFENCSNLSTIEIPESVEILGEFAFSGCTSLTSIDIPNSVTSIGRAAFQDCTSLSSIIIPESVESIESSAFYGCTALISLEIDGPVKAISYYMLSGCTNLTSLILPDSLESIEDNAFSGCTGLTSIIIPASVTTIGSLAFSNCGNLSSITVCPTTPPTGNYRMFFRTNSSLVIYVPSGSVEAYKTADYWSEYANMIQSMEGGYVPGSGDGGDS